MVTIITSWENKKFRNYYEVLQKLIKDRKIQKLAEVGVFKGRNLRNILRSDCKDVLSDYVAVDPWCRVRELTSQDRGKCLRTKDNEWDTMYKNVCSYTPYFKQLRILRLSSIEAAILFPKEYFDLVFIDADHIYSEVKRDIEAWLPLVKKGGILCGHDLGMMYPDVEKVITEKFGNYEDIDQDADWSCLDGKLLHAPHAVWIKKI